MILVKQAVPVIGTRFSDQRNLRARRSALVGVGIGCRHAKLLNRIRRHSQDAGEGIAGDYVQAALLLVYIYAIKRDIRLV